MNDCAPYTKGCLNVLSILTLLIRKLVIDLGKQMFFFKKKVHTFLAFCVAICVFSNVMHF